MRLKEVLFIILVFLLLIQFVYGSCGDADKDNDDNISSNELLKYINNWKSGWVAMEELVDSIRKWKVGCFGEYEKTGDANIDEMSEKIIDVDKINEELDDTDLDKLEEDLDHIDW